MANTYYDVQLAEAEIEQALQAINRVIIPANNNKVLAINNGRIEARSVQWGGSITPADEGKVVQNGALVAQTARATPITANGTYDTTLNNSVTVDVSGSSTIIPKPTPITQNGTYYASTDNADGYSQVTVDVSGGGSSSLYLVSPSELDDYNAANYKEGGLPCSGVMARYASAPFFTVGSNTFDGSTKPCLYRTNTDVCGIIFTHKITGGSYSKLYIKCIVTGTTQTAQRSWLGLLPSCNFANADGWFFEEAGNVIVKLTDTDLTPAEINAQHGVVINVSDNKNLPEQTVEITLPQTDVFVALLNWRCNIYVRELYLE